MLLEALAEGKVEARRKAAAVLGQVLSRKALPALAKAMNDKDSTVRSQAHSSFRRLAGAMLPYRNLDWRKVGYAYNATAKSRQAAVEKLTAWLKLVLPPK